MYLYLNIQKANQNNVYLDTNGYDLSCFKYVSIICMMVKLFNKVVLISALELLLDTI